MDPGLLCLALETQAGQNLTRCWEMLTDGDWEFTANYLDGCATVLERSPQHVREGLRSRETANRMRAHYRGMRFSLTGLEVELQDLIGSRVEYEASHHLSVRQWNLNYVTLRSFISQTDRTLRQISALHRSLVQSLEESADAVATLTARRLATAVMRLPIVPDPPNLMYGFEEVDENELEDGQECSICREPFARSRSDGDIIVRLSCKGRHVYDSLCIEAWLRRADTCPMDREEIV